VTPPRSGLSRSDFVLWPITSASQFGPRPLLIEPDIAIGFDQSRMTQAV
jgi:hypothetical protein